MPTNAAETSREPQPPAPTRRRALAVQSRTLALSLGALTLMAGAAFSGPAVAATGRDGAVAAASGGASPDQSAVSPAGHGDAGTRLEKIAQCESGGDPTSISRSGVYRGKYQFSRATWRSMGGHGDPAAAPESEQDRRAAKLMASRGPSAWPNCS